MSAIRQNWSQRIQQVKLDGRIPIIAELKRQSSTCGDLFKKRSITDIARDYIDGGAACISVVTGKWFGGDLSMLKEVADFTDLPILRKDFITNIQQINQSKLYGANAVLLTQQLLSDSHLQKMIDTCLSNQVTPFVEIANLKVLTKITNSEDIIIALCNRNILLKESDVDSGLPSVCQLKSIPFRKNTLVSASGIETVEDAHLLYECGFDALLVGTSLLRSDSPKLAVHKMSLLQK